MPVLSRPIYRMRVEWRRHSRSKASRRVPCSTTFDLQVEILARTPIFVSAWYPWIDSRSGHGCIVLLCLPFYVRCTFYGLRRGWAILALFLGKIHFFVTTGHAMLPLVNKHALYTMCNLLIFTFLPSFRYFCTCMIPMNWFTLWARIHCSSMPSISCELYTLWSKAGLSHIGAFPWQDSFPCECRTRNVALGQQTCFVHNVQLADLHILAIVQVLLFGWSHFSPCGERLACAV